MKASDSFPSKYLKASNLNGREPTVIISGYELEKVGRQGELKPVLFFRGKDKGLVLNKVNNETLILAYGDETTDWIDQPVTLFTVQTEFEGRPTTGIRVKVPPRSNAPPPPIKNEMDEEIPF
jgi:hypothetical protein